MENIPNKRLFCEMMYKKQFIILISASRADTIYDKFLVFMSSWKEIFSKRTTVSVIDGLCAIYPKSLKKERIVIT